MNIVNGLKIGVLFVGGLLTLQQVLLGMHEDGKAIVHFMDSNEDKPGSGKNYSIIQRWQDYEYVGCKNLVESLVGYRIIECFINKREQIGTFNGRDKLATTHFKDGHTLQYSYDDFIKTIGNKIENMVFKIDDYFYNIHGNKIASKIEKKKSYRCVIN